MTTCYKLTRQDNTTHNGCKWGEGVTHETSGEGDLCSSGWLHAYSHPLIAVFMNPRHADIKSPKLWECLGDGEYLDYHGLKCGYTRLTTVREIPLPQVTTEQRVAFAILCAKEVCKDPEWSAWADNWLRGANRTKAAARVAALAAARVAGEAVWVARAAASAADYAAAWAVAREAAREAALAAAWAADVASDIDLVCIAKRAMEY